MQINKGTIVAVLLLISGISSLAQNFNSPYSRYGIGDIDRSGFGQQRAMSGLSIGVRRPNDINYLNPASYSSQDTNSFIFDIGLLSNISKESSDKANISNSNTTFDHLAISFFITKNWYGSAGIVPFSSVKYYITESNPFMDGDSVYYKGSGGLNQFYLGNAVKFFNNRLSVGFNISCLFGNIHYVRQLETGTSSSYMSVNYNEKLAEVRGLWLNTGIQYTHPFSKKTIVTLGLTFDAKSNINTKYSEVYYNYVRLSNYDINYDTLNNDVNYGNLVLPNQIGLGFTVNHNNQIIAGIDYSMQQWSDVSLKWNDKMSNSYQMRFGLEVTPDPKTIRSYFAKVHYRCGLQFGDSYLKLNGKQINNKSISFGLGLPYRGSKTVLNISYEIGIRGTKQAGLIEESYNRLMFSLSFYDFWFYKPKYD
jgi:hypothetical protein